MPKIRYKKNNAEGYSDKFNTSGLGEILGSIGDDYDSWYIKELDVWLKNKQEWKDMAQAFRDRDLIPDDYNLNFSEPRTEEDRKRGYYY